MEAARLQQLDGLCQRFTPALLRITLYVNQLTDFDLGDPTRGLTRWQEPVCPLVTGLPQHMAEYVLERVSQVAQEVGAPLGVEKCRHPNLFVIVTKRPEADLRDLETRHLDIVFGDAAPKLIEDFISIPRPVRNWYDTVERTPEGLPLVKVSFPGISQQKVVWDSGGIKVLPVRGAIADGGNTNAWAQASHLTLNAVWAIKRVFVVVDPTKFKGVSLGQLADYVAMAGLAQVKLDIQRAIRPFSHFSTKARRRRARG